MAIAAGLKQWARLARLSVLGSAALSKIVTFNLVGRSAFTSGGYLFFANLLVLVPIYACLLSRRRRDEAADMREACA